MKPIHLFLTGEKQVGKSTLLQKLLARRPGPAAGFYTKKVRTVIPDSATVHILRPGEEPAPENMLFVCGSCKIGGTEKFNTLGCAALADCAGAGVILMDELGPHEGEAADFRAAVMRTLDGNIPVLGVLQEAPSAFLEEIAAHPKVQVLRVTRENRNDVEAFL